ncbi:hypothetical protein [Crystallibacter crystallopoietes]|uniref:hypothetical protein n=1 Tax=Crystallibacter crystallopoietes TaxID=37928 RepID=UPI00031FD2DB|nr:hypothetical protein [Arthrobacter crystallopoietes]
MPSRPLRRISTATLGIAVVLGSLLAAPAAAQEDPPGPANNRGTPAPAGRNGATTGSS